MPTDFEHRQPHVPVAKFRLDIGQVAKHILTPTATSEVDCKHFTLIVDGLETQLRVATLTRITDLISSTEPAEILPMRIDANDVRLTLQVQKHCCYYC